MVENNTEINISGNQENKSETIENKDTNLNENIENKEEEGASISGMVNQESVKSLMEMGFSKNVAEKSLFLNQQSIDKAMEWIYENQEQPDFEEELRLMGKQEKASANMTQEEIKAKAKELQDYARKRHLQKEKERAEEAEKNRIRMSKFIT